MTITELESSSILALGRCGENEVLTVEFDLSEYVDAYGAGTPTLIHRRAGDDDPYTVATTFDGSIVSWVINAADTHYVGSGECEIRYVVGEKLKKTAIFGTTVVTTMDDPVEDPMIEIEVNAKLEAVLNGSY